MADEQTLYDPNDTQNISVTPAGEGLADVPTDTGFTKPVENEDTDLGFKIPSAPQKEDPMNTSVPEVVNGPIGYGGDAPVAEVQTEAAEVEAPVEESIEIKNPQPIDLAKIEQENKSIGGDSATLAAQYLGLVAPNDTSVNINNVAEHFKVIGTSEFLPTNQTKQATYENRFDLQKIGESDAIGFVRADDPDQKLIHIMVPTYDPKSDEIIFLERDDMTGNVKADYVIDYDLPKNIKVQGPLKAVYLKSNLPNS